jgi:hypothetical protein
MSLNNSRASYSDCFTLFDRAMDADRGIRIEVPTTDAATYLRMRMHHARTIDRRENKVTYAEPDHPLHGRSPYDVFVIRLDPGEPAWVYLDKVKVEIGRVEEIPADHRIEYNQTQPKALAEPESEFEIVEPVRQIESPEKMKRRV